MSLDFLTQDPSILQIWTDGAINIHNEVLPGGWSSVFVYKRMLIDTKWAGVRGTTSQRMELTGALEALKAVYNTYCGTDDSLKMNKLLEFQEEVKEIQIVSDSQYLVTGMVAMWYLNWRLNNWISLVDGNPVKNRDLWEEILNYKEMLEKAGYTIYWRKVKGHKGYVYNEVADKLAVQGKKSVC